MMEFLSELISTWMGVWEAFRSFLDGFVTFGLGDGSSGRVRQAVTEHGTAEPSPTTQVLGLVYLVAKIVPLVSVLYFGLRYRVRRRYALGGALIGYLVWHLTSVWILEIRPSPLEEYRQISTGPGAVYTAIREMFRSQPIEAFTVWVVIFGTFFLFSFLMWYLVNFVLWLVTMTYKKEPVFSETSAKGHAFWMTLIWIFFLTMSSPGTAFVQTLFVLIAIVLNRAWKKRDIDLSRDTPEDRVLEMVEDGPSPDPSEEESQTGQIEWE